MKRSEMIEMIRDMLLDDLNLDMEYDHVDYLLSKIEGQGMLPPPSKLSKLNYIDNSWDEE